MWQMGHRSRGEPFNNDWALKWLHRYTGGRAVRNLWLIMPNAFSVSVTPWKKFNAGMRTSSTRESPPSCFEKESP